MSAGIPARARAAGLPLALLMLLALPAAGCGGKGGQAPAGGGPPPRVVVAPVIQKDVPIYLEAVGQTRGSVEVEIRARVEGYLEQMNFREGGWVQKGQSLYTIDPQPFQAALASARADLADAQAAVSKADRDVTRFTPLAAEDAISKQELDNALAAQESARARLDAAKAAVTTAQLNLAYCHITAPLSGVAGISQVSIGNLVGRGQSTLLTTISAIDPIWVRFSIPERDYLEYARRVESSGGPRFAQRRGNFRLLLADGSVFDQAGSLRASEPVVDPATGSLTLEAEFPNPKRLLLPGQFARVQAMVETRQGALLVPQRAVTELQGSYLVTVVKEDGAVEQRPVRTAQRIGTYWVIDSGLKPGERVVVEGQMRLRPGMKVQPEPAPAGADSLPPDPAA